MHHGWTLHSAAGATNTGQAAGQKGPQPRLAWTLGFVADGARLRRNAFELQAEDAVSYEAWASELGPGARVKHPMVPLLPEV